MKEFTKDYTVGIFPFSKKHYREIEKCGSSMIRGKWLWDNWPNAEEYIEGKKYDVVIFQKVWYRDLYEILCKDPDTIVILDLCDPEHLMAEKWPIIEISKMVDAIVVSSEGLYDEFVRLGLDKNCAIKWIDDRIDLSYFKFVKKKEHAGEAKKVGWYGYSGNAEKALPLYLPYLQMFNLKLHVIAENPVYFQEYQHSMSFAKHSWASIQFELLSCDFILNTPMVSPLSRFKSKNKTYLAWAFGLPVAHNIDEIKKYVHEDERKKEGDRVYDLVQEKYTVQTSIAEYQDLIKTLWAKKEQ